jgi:hypothetical protein
MTKPLLIFIVLITFTITNFPLFSTMAQEQQYSFVTNGDLRA